METRDVVILGGGPAGRVVVHMLHEARPDRTVTLIKDEPVNVNRCAVPYGVDGRKDLDVYRIPNALVTDFGAELIVDRVTRIDPAAREVHTLGGKSFRYCDLVLATGARPIVPALPGVEAANVLQVRSLGDLDALRQAAATGIRAVVVGGGYIGVEVGVMLRAMGLEVALVEREDHVLGATVEPEFLEEIEEELRERGMDLRTGRTVASVEANGDRATAAVLDDGTRLPADFVVMAVGVIPEVALAAEAGLPVTSLGIVVDDRLRAADHVYASGDCAEKRSLVTGRPVHGELGTNAVFMSRVVARNILGEDVRFPGVINASVSTAFDLSFGSAGVSERAAREAGLDVVTGLSEVLDRYPMMDGKKTIRTKLVFERGSGRLLGGTVLRRDHAVAPNVDFLSFAIQMGARLEDLDSHQYATHPELAAKPSDNVWTFAARAAR